MKVQLDWKKKIAQRTENVKMVILILNLCAQ